MDPSTNPPAPAAEPSKKIKARVLSPVNGHAAGTLAEFEQTEAKSLAAAGVIDTHKDAVAYAKEQAEKAAALAALSEQASD